MRVLIQRVSEATVKIDRKITDKIGNGLLLLLGIEPLDEQEDIEWLIKKIIQMRIFDDETGKMNYSILDVKGQILVISQFTLLASTKKGNRPSFTKAARPEIAISLYDTFVQELEKITTVSTGVFGADMKVSLTNNGPVTIWLDSKNRE